MTKPLIDIEGILMGAIEKMPKETDTLDVCEEMVNMAISQAQFIGLPKEWFLEAVSDRWDETAEFERNNLIKDIH